MIPFNRLRVWPIWKRKLFFGWTFVFTGTAFLAVSLGLLSYEAWFLSHSITAPGQITANIEQQNPADPATNTSASTCFHPQFQFADNNSASHTVISSLCSNPASFAVGDHVSVRSLRRNPANAQIDAFGEKWFLSLALGIAAFLLLPSGFFLFRSVRKQGHPIDLATLTGDQP
ncbi:MAG TPA: DUF3592 domain-containing protein [Acidobacteriaceae bacterium]|nr:DUF3592 domain-containing protein [Acidobacteriaceae bacterium]